MLEFIISVNLSFSSAKSSFASCQSCTPFEQLLSGAGALQPQAGSVQSVDLIDLDFKLQIIFDS